jgi:pyruvate/2-oxoglutarate dehydrogenase complex dihydrolipoamide dehydrogenase (E3) component
MATTHYDALIIGAGQGGMPLAFYLAGRNKRILLAERRHVGGSCINFGCTPTKTMVAGARVAYHCLRAADYGVRVSPPSVDMAAVRKRKTKIVESFRSSSRSSLEQADGIDLVDGHARFTGDHSVEVEQAAGGMLRVEADLVFIDTGSRSRIPGTAGLDAAGYLTSATVMDLSELPRHLAIIGGGYVGVEFAQMFRRFGADVSIIHRGVHLLSREDEDVAEQVTDILRGDGINVHTGTTPVEVHPSRDGHTIITLEGPEDPAPIRVTHVLVAAGRKPNSDDLGLENTAVQTTESGHVAVNEHLETAASGVYALGDVKGGPAFTHISYDDYRILRSNLEEPGSASTAGRMVPYVVYMDPELGRIGLSEAQASAAGVSFRVATLQLNSVSRALEMDETRGYLKALVGGDDRILGAAILAPFGGELMSAVQIAMMGGLPVQALREGTFAHPTLSESFNSLFASV